MIMKFIFDPLPRVLITIAVILMTGVNAQLNCSNYYNEDNLPKECQQDISTCIFPQIGNSSLLVNDTMEEQYGLCLDFNKYSILLEEGLDSLTVPIYLHASNITLAGGYSLTSSAQLVIVSQLVLLNNVSISAPTVWIQSTEIELNNASIIYQAQFGLPCKCGSKGNQVCQPPVYYFPYLYESDNILSSFNFSLVNYTYDNWIFDVLGINSVVFIASTGINLDSSTIKVSVSAIYAPSLLMSDSQVNSSGLGYSSGTGPGCGYFDQVLNQLLGCTGTGASHGGYGGNSGPQNCNLLVSSPPYNRELIPKYPGSGGGFFLQQLAEVSSGGGVINIQVQNLTLENSCLLANGVSGIQGGGGGSGGSISVDFQMVTVSGVVNISANGGNAKSSGGGGRVRYFYHQWTQVLSYGLGTTFRVEVAGGNNCAIDNTLTCGQKGSVVTSPCPPGYSLDYSQFACTPCPIGTYQLAYGYTPCYSCVNKPQNSNYKVPSPLMLSNYSQVCNFSCYNGTNNTEEFHLYKGRECLSSFNYVLADVGGINLLICIGIIVGTLVIFLIIMMIRKLSFSDRNVYDQSQHVDFFKKKSYFKIEDIPFHEMRIYFQGTNSPNHPWRISQHVERKLMGMEEYRSQLTFLNRLFRSLNDLATYSRSIHYSLLLLKIYYYPLGLFLSSKLKEEKAKRIRNQLIRRCRNDFDGNMRIKLHVNLKYTVGCLQLFNYNKETLDYYIKNYFPIYFKLQKLLIGGYGIDFTDPLFRALCSQFQQKSQKNQRLEEYLIELNQLLRNSDQTVTVFKHLWKINNVWPSLQCHLWQPDNTILGINDKNQIDKTKDVFLVFTTEGKDPTASPVQINRSLPIESKMISEEEERVVETKNSKHFLYKCDLPNFFFDEITCIRHKYHLREAMVDMEERRTIFWEVDNNLTEKTLSWILGTINILALLLTLLSFFLVIFLLVDRQYTLLYAFVPFFVLFPFCQFFTIFLQFSLLISKGARVFSFALYFSIFSAIKMGIVTIIELAITINNEFNDHILIILFIVWALMLLFNLSSLLLLSMLHVHYVKTR